MKQDKSMKTLHSILIRDRTQYERKLSKNLSGRPHAVNSSEITTFGRTSLFANLKQLNEQRTREAEVEPVRPQIVGALVPAKGKDPRELKKRAEATTLYHAQKLMKIITRLNEQY
jgi:hypothetical protein